MIQSLLHVSIGKQYPVNKSTCKYSKPSWNFQLVFSKQIHFATPNSNVNLQLVNNILNFKLYKVELRQTCYYLKSHVLQNRACN